MLKSTMQSIYKLKWRIEIVTDTDEANSMTPNQK